MKLKENGVYISSICSDYIEIHFKKLFYEIFMFEHFKGPTLNMEMLQ